jgi:hypothetical protein
MSERTELLVHLAYDDEAAVWYVAKSDIPGLSLEAPTPSELLSRVVEAAPELIELNSGMLAKVVKAELAGGEKKGRSRHEVRRPWAVRPVFDAPLELACA